MQRFIKSISIVSVVAMTAAAMPCLAADKVDQSWRLAFNVREADPIATTGITAGGADSVFDEPDAMAFVRRNPHWRHHLVASDIRFEPGAAAKSRVLIFDVKGPFKDGRMQMVTAFGEGKFVGKPKSLVEDSKGHFYVTDGLDKSDKVDDALRKQQGIHLFDDKLQHVKVFGQGVFESVNGIAIDRSDRVYVNERSKGLVRRFQSDGTLDTSWTLDDPEVQKADNMIIDETMVVAGTRGVILLSDEERGMVRVYALADGKFINTVIGNETTCAPRRGDDAKTCFRRQSLFTGNVEGMALYGNLLVFMDEADKPLSGKEDGGVIWFFDVRKADKLFNRSSIGFAGKADTALIGGIHKLSAIKQKKLEKNFSLAAQVPAGTFISPDSLDIHRINGRHMLAVANQGVLRLELFDLERMLDTLGVDAKRRASLLASPARR